MIRKTGECLILVPVPDSVKDGDECDVLASKGKLRGKFGISPKMHVKFENTECSVSSLEFKRILTKTSKVR